MEQKCVICDIEIHKIKKNKYCSNKCKQKAHYDRATDKTNPNTYFSQDLRATSRKLMLIELKGGGCQKCNYNKNIAALDFHHRDVSEKEFQLDMRTLGNRTLKSILIEAEKCDLICATCHREEHCPECEMENVKSRVEIMEQIKIEKKKCALLDSNQ